MRKKKKPKNSKARKGEYRREKRIKRKKWEQEIAKKENEKE